VPGDKSIAHRAALFSLFARGTTIIRGYPIGVDNLTSLSVVEDFGVQLDPVAPGVLHLKSPGMKDLKAPVRPIDCMNSGTTARLLAGILAGLQISAQLTGDSSLRGRPMERVARPLRIMGAEINTLGLRGTMPLKIDAKPLHGAEIKLEIASAQVKSAILLAGIGANGTTKVTEPYPSRDHTERLLEAMGVPIEYERGYAEVKGPPKRFRLLNLEIPADPSSAAFLVVLACLHPDSSLVLEDVLLNPTRVGFLRVLKRMGASIQTRRTRRVHGETIADLHVKSAPLKGTKIRVGEIPTLIDELPILAVAMAMAEGESSVHGAEELRVKESDRLSGIVQGMRTFGVDIEETRDGYLIWGPSQVVPAQPITYVDHRLVMAFSVLATLAEGTSVIPDAHSAEISYPTFAEDLVRLGVRINEID
jgi:3-phosphoshikimate 1-carboxyvinyltransferase